MTVIWFSSALHLLFARQLVLAGLPCPDQVLLSQEMAEAVAIVLAIAPLVISAVEDYENTAKCVRAFKAYHRLVKTHLSTLNIQQTIFRKANERLLCGCVPDEDHAREMLADRDHPFWKDQEIAAQYVDRLRDSKSAFADSIGLISDELAAIRAVLAKFEGESEAPGLLKKRLKYAFKEGQIERSLSTLTEKTRDLVSLIDITEPSRIKVTRSGCSFATKKQLSRFSKVKETAQDLYEALGHACTKHTGHQAHLSLEPAYCDPSQIRFTIAFSQLTLDPGSKEQATWLTVESSISGRLLPKADSEPLNKMQSSLKRAFADSDIKSTAIPGSAKSAKKCLRFQDTVSVAPEVSPSTGLTDPLANLCKNSNFCTHLQKFISQSQPSRTAIGYLELSGPSKHLVYIDAKWQTVRQTSASAHLRSLHDTLVETSAVQVSSPVLSLDLRLRLAKQLATAVLHFHATSWLRNSWTSREVLMSAGDLHAEDNGSTPETFVTTQIRGPHGPLARAQTLPSPIVVRNRLLFSLGVMLLELAYQHPLSALTIERDKDVSNPGNTEYFTADRLSRQVSAHMGARYAEITRKCVHCDFGCDFDLSQAKLQEGFYQDVVCELDKLEKRMRDL